MGRVNQGQTQSDQVDHQETENRTHDGDDITPATLEATGTLTDPSGASHTGELADENAGIVHPVYASTSDVPSDITEGETVYISGDGLYVEDGT